MKIIDHEMIEICPEKKKAAGTRLPKKIEFDVKIKTENFHVAKFVKGTFPIPHLRLLHTCTIYILLVKYVLLLVTQ